MVLTKKYFDDHRCLSRSEKSKCIWTHSKDGIMWLTLLRHLYRIFTYISPHVIEKGICDHQNILSLHVLVFKCTLSRDLFIFLLSFPFLFLFIELSVLWNLFFHVVFIYIYIYIYIYILYESKYHVGNYLCTLLKQNRNLENKCINRNQCTNSIMF